jgi:hypothetical protein
VAGWLILSVSLLLFRPFIPLGLLCLEGHTHETKIDKSLGVCLSHFENRHFTNEPLSKELGKSKHFVSRTLNCHDQDLINELRGTSFENRYCTGEIGKLSAFLKIPELSKLETNPVQNESPKQLRTSHSRPNTPAHQDIVICLPN